MSISKIFGLYNLMSDHQFMMSYNGIMSQHSVRSLLSVAEKKIVRDEPDVGTRKKVFNVMMECLQSICKGESTETDSFFMLGKDQEHYSIYVCFYCSPEYAEEIAQFLDELSTWDAQKLKEEHRLRLRETLSGVNNPALYSLIDITLKSKNPISYGRIAENDRVFITMRTTVKHSAAE